MRKLLIVLAGLLFGTTLFSQTVDDYMEVQRAALKAEKKAVVADAMQFTDTVSKALIDVQLASEIPLLENK